MSRRYLFPILFLLVLAAPFAVRSVVAPADRTSGTSSDADRLVIVTPNPGDINREFAIAFDSWHRRTYNAGVTVDYRTPGGTNDIKRLLSTIYRAKTRDGRLPPESEVVTDLDIVWGGGDFFFDQELKPLGILSDISLSSDQLAQAFPSPTLAGVRLYDYQPGHPPKWVGGCLSSFGIAYSPDLYRTLNLPAPQTWRDLTDAKLCGLLALADPSHSGSAATSYMVVIQRAMADAEAALFKDHPEIKQLGKGKYESTPQYRAALSAGFDEGMRQLTLMAANARYFTDSAPTVTADIGNGEAAAGIAIDFYGRVYEESVGPNRCTFVQPRAATAVTPDPIAILYGVKGRHRELANHFIEFLLSKDGQLLWCLKAGSSPGAPRFRSLRRLPVRRDVYADRTGWSDDIDPFELAGDFNQRPEWMSLFTDLRPLWSAAWIDSRDDLRSAYTTVLAVPDADRREQLRQSLGRLPITMADVEALKAERRKREAAGGAEEWKARSRMDWAQKFRDHYASIQTGAGSR